MIDDTPNPVILRPHGPSDFVLFCDHGSNYVPAELEDLGLPKGELSRHIAWDIGAAGVTRALSEILDAPAILCSISRLVIDCNRQLESPNLIPVMVDGTEIPGNQRLTEPDRASRIQRWFQPYHDAIESIFLEREARNRTSVAVSIHSMTATLDRTPRPWQIALSSHVDRSFSDPVLAALRAPNDVVVGDNQPYDLDPAVDYSLPFHAMRRGLPHIQVEFRQDEIQAPSTQHHWAHRFSRALLAHDYR